MSLGPQTKDTTAMNTSWRACSGRWTFANSSSPIPRILSTIARSPLRWRRWPRILTELEGLTLHFVGKAAGATAAVPVPDRRLPAASKKIRHLSTWAWNVCTSEREATRATSWPSRPSRRRRTSISQRTCARNWSRWLPSATRMSSHSWECPSTTGACPSWRPIAPAGAWRMSWNWISSWTLSSSPLSSLTWSRYVPRRSSIIAY